MRERLRIFFNLALFWLSFMLVARIVFLVYNYDYTATLTSEEIGLTLLHGLRMDASISGYFLAAYGLALTISSLVPGDWISRTILYLTLVLLVVCSLLVSIDMELYRHWGFRMNTTPLMYIGAEAMGNVHSAVYLKVSYVFLLLLLSFFYLFRRKLLPRIKFLSAPTNSIKSTVALFVCSALMFLPIR